MLIQAKSVEEYILKCPEWQEELLFLRKIFQKTSLKEEVKWGAPIYTLKGKNVVGMAAFKNWVTLWFHQGVFLKDEAGVLTNAQEGKTKALRQWRFEKKTIFDEQLLLQYILEAIENQKQGKEVKIIKKTSLVIPSFLAEAFLENPVLKTAFDQLSLGRQREYTEYINNAKQEKTKKSRLAKCKPLLLNGIGLNDKYR